MIVKNTIDPTAEALDGFTAQELIDLTASQIRVRRGRVMPDAPEELDITTPEVSILVKAFDDIPLLAMGSKEGAAYALKLDRTFWVDGKCVKVFYTVEQGW